MICIWGTGINALNFSLACDEPITAYIDNNPVSDRFEFNGLPVVKPDRAEKYLKENYIIVASSEPVYWEIKKQLEQYGLVEFKNFCYCKNYRKKIAIVYGNCHITPIIESLYYSDEFKNEYGIYPLPLIQTIAASKDNILGTSAIENCDLFIHQDIRDDNKYGYDYSPSCLTKRLKKTCISICIPNLHSLPKYYFPQADSDMPQKEYMSRNYYPFHDLYIEKMYEAGKSIEYIENAIRKDNVFSESMIDEKFEMYISKINKREQFWSVKISDWLISQNKKNRLFYDYNHPSGNVLSHIAQMCLDLLGFEYCSIDKDRLTELDSYELPVYGQVMDKFHMEWKNDYIMKKNSKYTISGTQISLHEYIREYLLWYHK